MKRRQFLLSGFLSGLMLSLLGSSFTALASLAESSIKIKGILRPDKNKTIRKINKFFFQREIYEYVEPVDKDNYIKFHVKVLNNKKKGAALLGTRVGVCNSDAFKSSNGKIGSADNANILWFTVQDENFFSFFLRKPSLVVKSNKLMNPIDFLIIKNEKISISRVNINDDFPSKIDPQNEYSLYAYSLTDKILDTYGQSIDKPIEDIQIHKLDGLSQAVIEFMVDDNE